MLFSHPWIDPHIPAVLWKAHLPSAALFAQLPRPLYAQSHSLGQGPLLEQQVRLSTPPQGKQLPLRLLTGAVAMLLRALAQFCNQRQAGQPICHPGVSIIRY